MLHQLVLKMFDCYSWVFQCFLVDIKVQKANIEFQSRMPIILTCTRHKHGKKKVLKTAVQLSPSKDSFSHDNIPMNPNVKQISFYSNSRTETFHMTFNLKEQVKEPIWTSIKSKHLYSTLVLLVFRHSESKQSLSWLYYSFSTHFVGISTRLNILMKSLLRVLAVFTILSLWKAKGIQVLMPESCMKRCERHIWIWTHTPLKSPSTGICANDHIFY